MRGLISMCVGQHLAVLLLFADEAAALYELKEYDRAAVLFRRAYALNPGTTHIALQLGKIAFHQQNYTECLGRLRPAAALTPALRDVQHYLGECLYYTNQYGPAATAFTLAVIWDPGAVKNHVCLSDCWYQLAECERAALLRRRLLLAQQEVLAPCP